MFSGIARTQKNSGRCSLNDRLNPCYNGIPILWAIFLQKHEETSLVLVDKRGFFHGDPYRIRTDVKGVRGLCLNHLTNGPYGKSPAIRSVTSC